MTRHADAIGRAYEKLGRARKVARILAIIPPGHLTPGGGSEVAIELLEAATPQQRADFAKLAGVNPPSDETWREVIKAVRDRQRPVNTNSGVFCDGCGLLRRACECKRDPVDHITRG